MTQVGIGQQCSTCSKLIGFEAEERDMTGQPLSGHWFCAAFPKGCPANYAQDKKPCPKRALRT